MGLVSEEQLHSCVQAEGFELLSEVGRGASARILLAREISTGDKVCLKLFHPRLFQEATSQARIRREMELSSKLKHPHILAVRRFVLDTPSPYMVLDYVPGKNLEKFQASLPYILPEVAVQISIQILKALEYSHRKGIVHRDLKPENVLVREDGQVFVADFGLAKGRDHAATNLSNTLVGSVDYMSPEQVKGDSVGPQSDLFSLGAVLYFLTTGTRPFSRGSIVATLEAVKNAAPESPLKRNPKISNRLSALILKAMARDVSARFQSATEMRTALEGYLADTGLSENTFNLHEWMVDPSAVTMDALGRCVETLTARAEKLLAQREWDAFTEVQSHLSIKAPESESLRRLSTLYRSTRRAKTRPVLRWSLVAVWLLVIVGAAVFYWPKNPQPQSLPSPVVANPAPVEVAPAVPAETIIPDPKPAPHKSPAAAKLKAPSAGAGTVWFRLPQGTEVYWNGFPVDPEKPLYNQKFGLHDLKMIREGFDPITAKVEVSASRPTIIKVN